MQQAEGANHRLFWLGLGIALLAFLVDQASKWVILEWVMAPPRVITVTGFFDLVLVFNRGVSFGLFNEAAGWQPLVFSLLAVAVSAFLMVWLWRQPSFHLAVSFGLVIGGAIGNALDRWVHGAVVDFLSFHWDEYYWPAFNGADSAIFVGVAVMIGHDLLSLGRRGGKNPPLEDKK